ncbi:helix-turn-helix domain-containing protein [Streptomyces tropicalis]|uniref:Helix-turn-helix transcriptional regulator n=1 Tax=Streptomyces tropicalis TaxID=3034234 RepID=A0ABT5ZY93_9ACTN|nr:helix-turn-helix transcriptional regulator [Streptomyces tropicalis]MDF3297371.1 helix-turn-helix transcriptional regulator [Streptomyces tropicalis]
MVDGVAVTGGAGSGGEPESSDSLRTFGAVVQGLREHAGLSREEFGARVRYSRHTVASVELGRRMPDPAFVERAEEALGNTGALRRAAGHLARQPGLAAWFRQWARMEQVAVTLCTYECRVVPGLLQTEAYARAMATSVPPIPDGEQLAERIAARLARQELLSARRRPPCAFSFIVEQSVLERQTGGPDVTREVVGRLLEVGEGYGNVEVQVMPLCQPVHAGLDGPLQLLETPEHHWFAYSEGQNNGRLISDPKEISVLHQRYAKLRSQALTPEDSRRLLERMRGAL